MARSTTVKGFSLTAEAVLALEKLTARAGVSQSRLVNDLLLREASRSGAPEVVVDGRRFVPARRRS